MKHDLIIGIDPGVSNGGIAIKQKSRFAEVVRCPREFDQMQDLFWKINHRADNPLAFIEIVQLFSQDMTTPGKAFGLQKLFKHFNSLRDALESQRIPYVEVYPQTWQAYLKLKAGFKSETDTERKNRYKRTAQSIFPEIRATNWSADALLLVQFGVKKLYFDQSWIDKRIKLYV